MASTSPHEAKPRTCTHGSRLVTAARRCSRCVAAPRPAQGYPNRPIKVVVPYPPGGGTDVVARIVTQKMAAILDSPIVVDNRAGAGGNIGTEYGASPADGYTLLVATGSRRSTTRSRPTCASRSSATSSDRAVGVEPERAGRDAVAAGRDRRRAHRLAKARPGQLTVASSGIGSSAHLWAELFEMKAGVDFTHVPYKGTAPAQSDLVGGQVNSDVFRHLGRVAARKSG